MTDFRKILADLRRPALLLRAARCGLSDYQRDRDLRRILRLDSTAGPEKTLPRLIRAEEEIEEIRQSGDASYSLNRHIELLIALLCEANLLPRAPQGAA